MACLLLSVRFDEGRHSMIALTVLFSKDVFISWTWLVCAGHSQRCALVSFSWLQSLQMSSLYSSDLR